MKTVIYVLHLFSMDTPQILKIANMEWFTEDIKQALRETQCNNCLESFLPMTPCAHTDTHIHTRTSVKLRISASSVRSRVFGGSEGWEFLCLAHRCLLKTQPILLHLLYSSLDILSFSSYTFLALVFLGLQSRLLCFMFPVSVSASSSNTESYLSHHLFHTFSPTSNVSL